MFSMRALIFRFSHFFTASSLSILVGLVSFPILTRILSKVEYGMLGLVSSTMLIAVAVAKAGLSDGIIRFLNQYSSSEESKTLFASTIVLRGILLSTIAVVLYFLALPVLFAKLNIDARFRSCFKIMSLYLFIRPLNVIVLNFLNGKGKTIFLNSINLLERILTVGLSISFLLIVFKNLNGYFIGAASAEALISVPLFAWFFSEFSINVRKISKNLTFKLIKFGMPLLVSEILILLLSYGDRYLILWYLGPEKLGMYSVGYNLAMYVSNTIMFSLSYAIIPIYVNIYEQSGKEETERFLKKTLEYLLIGIIPICVGYSAVCRDLMVFLASNAYEKAAEFSPIILISTILLGMNKIFNAGLYLKGKTKVVSLIMFVSVCSNLLANVVFIPKWGLIGAAYATFISCLLSVLMTIFLSFRFIFVKLSWESAVYYASLSYVMFLVLEEMYYEDICIRLFSKVGVGVLITMLGILVRERIILGIRKKRKAS